MKKVMAGLSYIALVGLAFASFVGESMAGSRHWAAVEARKNLPAREECRPAAALQKDLWDEQLRYCAARAERWASWKRRWWALSFGTCVLALLAWRFFRTDAAGICVLLCVSLALLSLAMWCG